MHAVHAVPAGLAGPPPDHMPCANPCSLHSAAALPSHHRCAPLSSPPQVLKHSTRWDLTPDGRPAMLVGGKAWTPLCYAAAQGRHEMTGLLLAHAKRMAGQRREAAERTAAAEAPQSERRACCGERGRGAGVAPAQPGRALSYTPLP